MRDDGVAMLLRTRIMDDRRNAHRSLRLRFHVAPYHTCYASWIFMSTLPHATVNDATITDITTVATITTITTQSHNHTTAPAKRPPHPTTSHTHPRQTSFEPQKLQRAGYDAQVTMLIFTISVFFFILH